MKVLFLDVDGVLNSLRSLSATGEYGRMGSPSSWQHLDPIAVKLIAGVCLHTNSRVVLSSTWRLGATLEDVTELGEFLGVYITGVTPRSSTGWRGIEIEEWLSEHPEVETYAIVDDDGDMLPSQKEHFVHTTFSEGLSYKNYQELVEILS